MLVNFLTTFVALKGLHLYVLYHVQEYKDITHFWDISQSVVSLQEIFQ